MRRSTRKLLIILLSIMMMVTYMVPASVFAETTAAAGDIFQLVDTLEDGGEYLIVSSNSTGSQFALTNPGGTSDGASMGKTAVTVTDIGGVPGVEGASADIIWTATAHDQGFDLTNGSDYLEGKGGSVKIWNSQQYDDRFWTYSGNALKHNNNYMVYYSTNSNAFNSNTSGNRVIYLYKKMASGTASVTGVSLDQTELALKAGHTASLKATVTPSDAANKAVTWTSDDPSVATVAGGTVTAVGAGTATIIVTTEDGGFTASCTVTVTQPKTETYRIVDAPEAGGTYLIVSSNAAGTAYALTNPGATSGGTAMGATPVTLYSEDGDIYTDIEEDESVLWEAIANGSGFNLKSGTGYLEGASGGVKIYTSLANAGRHWTYIGEQLQHTGGSNTYIVYYDGGFKATYNSTSEKVYFFEKYDPSAGPVAVTGVSLDQESLALKTGGTASLKATVSPANAANKAVTWTTTAASVAAVDGGTVTAVGAGTATITVTTEDGGFTASCEVTVTQPQTETYKIVGAPESGGTYLIVSTNQAGNAYALTNPGGTSGGAAMGATALTLYSRTRAAGDVCADVEAEADMLWTVTANGAGFNLTNGSDYLEGKSGKVGIYSAQQYADRYWTYENDQLQHVGGQNSYTVYYSDGFTDTYNETDGTVYFMEKDTGGETPDPDPIPVESITMDKTELSLEAGKTGQLTATVLPENADDKTVTWISGDPAVATVSGAGLVTGVAEGTTTIQASAGGKTAVCAVTVTKKAVTGQAVNIGITSDVHGAVPRLRDWITNVQSAYDPDLDSMLYCGDYSYQMNNLDSFVADFQEIVAATNELVGDGRGVYTSGNHEYYIGGREIPLDERFTSTPGFVRRGEALVRDNYIVYCLGAAAWYDGIGTYPQEDINALAAYLDSAPTDIPIFIPAHYPLHYFSRRTITNADKVIEVLNEHPNTVFLWGHNHSMNDTHYGQILVAGDSIEYASGKSEEITFTYACAGGMYQDSQTQYSGLVASVSGAGDEVTFQYYRTTGAAIGDPVTIHISGSPQVKHTITAGAGANGTISPSGEVQVTDGKNKEFTFKADAGYTIDTVTVDGQVIADPGKSYTFENVTADHTINVTFKEKEIGEGSYYKLVSAFQDDEDYLIVSTNSAGSGYALTRNGTSMAATAITIEEGDVDNDGVIDKYIDIDAEDVVWTTAAHSSGYDLTNDGYYIEGKGGNIVFNTTMQYKDRYWTYANDYLHHEGGSYTYELYYNNGFTSRSFNSGSGTNKVYIYEKATYVPGTDPVESVELDKTAITLKEGKTEQLTATVLPSSAADKSVIWSTSDETVATVDSKGLVTAVGEGTATITVMTNDGGKTADCTVTVEPYIPGSGVNVGVTSDVHGNITGLRNWLTVVQEDYDPDLDSMLYCGDYSYNMNNLSDFVADFRQVVSATDEIIGEGKGIYTSGNHEYYIGGREILLDEQFTSTPGFVRLGEALVTEDYIVYCMGAASWGSNAVGEYPQADINALATYLDSAPADIPILIPAHFPLHYISGRTVTNADKVIEVLNEHPNAIFFWGHNHSQNDPHYGQIVKAGGSIEYASGKSSEINFTYTCAGGMYQDSQTNYSGVVVHIEKATSGRDVTFQYYRTSTGLAIGEPVTVHVDGEVADTFTITAAAGENGAISPSGAVSVREGKDRSFTFKPNAGYEVDTVTVDGEEVAFEGESYTFTNVTADHTIGVTFKKADVTEYILTDVARANGSYLIISGGYALLNDGGTIGAVPVQMSEDGKTAFVRTGDLQRAILWTLKQVTTEETSGDYTVENDGYMIIRVSGGESGGADNPAEITTEQKYSTYSGLPYFEWSYDVENARLTMVGGQNGDSTFYFYYNSAEDKFYTTTTEQSTGLFIPASPETIWGDPVYTWAEDYSTCTATRTGTEGSATVEDTETVTATAETVAATCEADGKTTYTAVFKSDVFETQTAEVAIPATGHDWDAPTYEWSEDNKTVTATRACKNDPAHVETETAAVTGKVTKAATCEEAGETTYTAVFENEAFETQTKVLADVEALGHDWGEPTYEWAEDLSTVTATRVCGNDPTHVETETADTVSAETKPATETEAGTVVYTATFANEAFATQTKEIELPPTGYEVSYEWAADNSTVTGTAVPYASGAATITETVDTAAEVTKPATCEAKGETTYTAVFTKAQFETQTKAVENIEALGHDWGEPTYEWAEDLKTVTAVRVCKNDPAHTETETAAVTGKVTKAATCEEAGETTYTATFENEIFETQTKVLADIEPIGHDWGEATYVWAADYSAVTATRACSHDAGHVQTEIAQTRSEVTRPATCEEKGENTYTAVFINPAFETQTRTAENIDALDHDYGFTGFEWAEDFSAASAVFTCSHDPAHVQKIGAAIYTDITEPTCEVDGVAVYTATLASNLSPDGVQHIDVGRAALPATGHSFVRKGWTWKSDYSAATLDFECSVCGKTEKVEGTVSATHVEPTCEEKGQSVYTAIAEFEGNEYTSVKEITHDALGHDWSEPTFEWAEDGSSVTAARVCGNDPAHVETETAQTEGVVTKPATCEEKGETTYTAVFENPAFGTQSKTIEDAPAIGHKWDAPTYVWAEDLSTVTATRICKNDPAHKETETVDTSYVETKPATETEAGIGTFTATFENSAFADQTKEIVLQPTGFKVTYVWAEDNTSVTATAVPYAEGAATITETVSASYEVTREASCEIAGIGTWTSEAFENTVFGVQTREIEIEAIGHDWGEATYGWTKDNGTVIATRTCKHDPDHVETETARTTSEVTKAATCEEAGETTYTAVFTNPGFAAQTKTAADIEPIGHDWGKEAYEWAADSKTVTAKRTCKHDPSHEEIEVAQTTAAVERPATCTAKGDTTYTAKFLNEAFETQSRTVTDIEPTGHDYGEWIVSKEPTCTETGTKYRVCRHDAEHKEIAAIPATGHKLTKVAARAATPSADGCTEHWICEHCGKYFSDAAGKTEIAPESVIIPAFTEITITKSKNYNAGTELTWTKVEGATGYEVSMKSPDTGWTVIAENVKGTTYMVPKKLLKSGTKYTYRVKALGVAPDYSNSKAQTYLEAPVISKMTNTTAGVVLTWGPVEGAKTYTVMVGKGDGYWTTLKSGIEGTTWTVPKDKLTSGTTYVFNVKAKGAATSGYNSGKTKTYIEAPVVKSVTKVSSGVTVTWGTVKGANTYTVMYKEKGGSWKTAKSGVTGTSYTVPKSKLTSGKTYYFTVKGIGAATGAYTGGKSLVYKA